MSTVFVMTPGSWGAVRFAPSWLWETMPAVRTLSVRDHQGVHLPWPAQLERAAARGGPRRRRGEIAAGHGMRVAVDGVHPTVSAGAREIRCAVTDAVTVRCPELVLMPSVFGRPHPTAGCSGADGLPVRLDDPLTVR